MGKRTHHPLRRHHHAIRRRQIQSRTCASNLSSRRRSLVERIAEGIRRDLQATWPAKRDPKALPREHFAAPRDAQESPTPEHRGSALTSGISTRSKHHPKPPADAAWQQCYQPDCQPTCWPNGGQCRPSAADEHRARTSWPASQQHTTPLSHPTANTPNNPPSPRTKRPSSNPPKWAAATSIDRFSLQA